MEHPATNAGRSSRWISEGLQLRHRSGWVEEEKGTRWVVAEDSPAGVGVPPAGECGTGRINRIRILASALGPA